MSSHGEPAEPMTEGSSTADSAKAPDSSEDARQYLVHLERMNSVYYDQIKIADQKAAFIFTFMLAFLVSSAEGSSVFRVERYHTGSWAVIVLSAVMAVAIALSLVNAILVVLPPHRTKASSLYWGAWPANRDLFIAAHEKRDPEYLFNEYLNNVDNLALINRSKYRHVGHSFRGLVVAVLAYLLLLIVGSAGL
jgi:hypothetical protein